MPIRKNPPGLWTVLPSMWGITGIRRAGCLELEFTVKKAPGPILTLTPSVPSANKGETVTVSLSLVDCGAEVACQVNGADRALTSLGGDGKWSVELTDGAPATYVFTAVLPADGNHETSTAACSVLVEKRPYGPWRTT